MLGFTFTGIGRGGGATRVELRRLNAFIAPIETTAMTIQDSDPLDCGLHRGFV
jgi:hypothetical protein